MKAMRRLRRLTEDNTLEVTIHRGVAIVTTQRAEAEPLIRKELARMGCKTILRRTLTRP